MKKIEILGRNFHRWFYCYRTLSLPQDIKEGPIKRMMNLAQELSMAVPRNGGFCTGSKLGAWDRKDRRIEKLTDTETEIPKVGGAPGEGSKG